MRNLRSAVVPPRPGSSRALVLVSILLAFGRARADAPLDAAVESVLARPELAGSSFGIEVRHIGTGEVVFAHGRDALLPPASTAKLVSSAGALLSLGLDHRFETRVVRTGPLENGVVQGDVILVASGDPNLSQRVEGADRLRFVDCDHTYAGFVEAEVVPGDPLAVLRTLARRVAASGVKTIRGDVVIDDGLFLEEDDSFVGRFSAFCMNDNVVDMTVSPGDGIGAAAHVEIAPAVPVIDVEAAVRTVAPGGPLRIRVESRPGVASFIVEGTIPLGAKPVLRVGAFSDPALAGAHVFAHLLESEGIVIEGSRRTARFGPAVYSSHAELARHRSPPLSEALRVILKTSHNLHATMLPVIIGAERRGRGTRTDGFEVIAEQFRKAGLDPESVILQSGSGGDRIDRLSAHFLVDLLAAMARREEFPTFIDALPIAGVDGTLATHLRAAELRGRVRAKTGTLVYRGSFGRRWIYLSKALAGYLDLRTEESPDSLYAFSILIANTVCDDRARGVETLFRAQEDLLEAIVDWHRRRVAAARGEDDPRASERAGVPVGGR